MRLTNIRRIVCGANQYEIVVHDIGALGGEAVLDKALFSGGVVYQKAVGVAATGDFKGLPCAHCHHPYVDAGGVFELR